MMTHNDAVVMQQFCMLMTFNDALLVLSTKNDGHCHHLRMGVSQTLNGLVCMGLGMGLGGGGVRGKWGLDWMRDCGVPIAS